MTRQTALGAGWGLLRTTVGQWLEDNAAYGAAGSLAILLVWIYYSTQIFFLGAEFTQVYARTYGAQWMEHEQLKAKPDQTATYRGGK